jgi:hypothetical protein
MLKVRILSICSQCNGQAIYLLAKPGAPKARSTHAMPLAQCVKAVVRSLSGSAWLTSINSRAIRLCGVAGHNTGYGRSVWSVISGSSSGSYFLPAARIPPE